MMREVGVERTYELRDDTLVAHLPRQRRHQSPDKAAWSVRSADGQWTSISEREFYEQIVAVAKGLIAGGISPGDRVALMADTSYEWVLVDMAIWHAGGATVPIYPSSSSAQIEWIVKDSGAKMLLVGTAAHARTAAAADISAGCRAPLVIADGALDTLVGRGAGAGIADGEIEARLDGLTLDQTASVIYTSGTTGRPKGCVMSHRNLAAEVQTALSIPVGDAVGPGTRGVMFLPLAHVLARAVTYMAYSGGSNTGFWADTTTVVDRLQEFHPTFMLGVPRVFEKLHNGIATRARAGGAVKAAIFARARKAAIAWSRARGGDGAGDRRAPSLTLRLEHALFDRLVYRNVRAAVGGQCMYALTGGGALSAELNHFFRGLGLPLYEGYGLTESTAAITVNGPGEHRIGTVGRPLPGNAVRIAADGEVELRGDVVFSGYWQNDAATAEVFDGDWFRTGDIGELDAGGYLKITGRKKELIVTAGGKNVAPVQTEEILNGSELIGHSLLVGEGRPYIGALITLDTEAAKVWAARHGKSGEDLAALARDVDVHAEVERVVEQAAQQVSRAESIRKFVILPSEFSEETGELTATMKVRRHIVAEKYAEEIESLYAS